MTRAHRPTASAASGPRAASVEVTTSEDAALVTVTGLVDERFTGFGELGDARVAVIHVGGITRMTSFGVRQWLVAMEALPRTLGELYLLGCPTFFVDQLNMVLNFGGAARVLTVVAPYLCPSCGAESSEPIDILAHGAALVREPPEKECGKCGAKLEFDETPESYFAFAAKHGASSIEPAAAQLLAAHGLYLSASGPPEKPPRVIKLVHGTVTYFRIIGTIGSSFRARPFLVGAEGELVIDLAEVDRFAPGGQKEWRRLVKTLAQQVTATTLVDVPPSLLEQVGDTLTSARVTVASLLAPYACLECSRTFHVSMAMSTLSWPPVFENRVCATCGGATHATLAHEALQPLQHANSALSPATAKVVEQRHELLSRAETDAKVARSGGATTVGADDTILGKYKIVRALSAGGMAEVFLAKQVGIGGFEKPVAIKRIQNKLLESRHQAIELFLNEAKIAGRLTHPNIAQVIDVGEEGGALYLAMEYVHGKDLRDVLKALKKRNGTMPLAEACYVVRDVAQALDHAYWSTDMTGKRMSVVHRDVSPHNVILGFDGTVKLIDFGVAMSAVTEHEQQLIVGKWTYMSPETTLNGQADHRSDLFSLGAVLYLLCSGAMPFSGREPKEIVRKIRAGEYKPLEEVVPNVPPRLATLVGRLLDPSPDRRPQRGQEVAAELTEIARAYGLVSSGSKIADFLAGLFVASDVASGSPVKEIVRVYPGHGPGGPDPGHDPGSDSVMPTQVSKSLNSLTPSARTARAPKISESFPRVTETFRRHKESTAPPLTMAPPPRPRVELPDPERRQLKDTLVNFMIALAILGVVVLGAYLILSNS